MPPVVHQIVPNFAFADAVGNQILATRDLLTRLGCETQIYADHWDPRLSSLVRPTADYLSRQAQEHWLILHYCICGHANHVARETSGNLVTYYHNVTPARFFFGYEPAAAACCGQARRQLKGFVAPAQRLRRPWRNDRRLRLQPRRARVVWVLRQGRRALHPQAGASARRVEHAWQRSVARTLHGAGPEDLGLRRPYRTKQAGRGSGARLPCLSQPDRAAIPAALGGQPTSRQSSRPAGRYSDEIAALIARLDLQDSVIFPGLFPAESLGVFYELADVYVSLSEHEGFCVPLVEAMSFGVPILAFDSTAVPGTLGGSGVLLHRKEPQVVAEVAHEVIGNHGLRTAIVGRQRERLTDFEPGAMRAQLHKALIAAGIPLPPQD